MKKTDTEILCDKLLSYIHTSHELKQVSLALETIAIDRHFKNHADSIVNDSDLKDAQKKRQLLYLLGTIENSTIHNFFSDEVDSNNLWIFDLQKIDYLDEFIKKFQQATEKIITLHLTSAKDMTPQQIRTISKDLSHEFGTKIIIEHSINKNLIGGVVVKFDNYIFDYSIRSKFQQFQREWLSSLERTSKLTGRYDPLKTL